MKKKLSIAAVLLLSALITMTACGDGSSSDSSEKSAPAAVSAQEETSTPDEASAPDETSTPKEASTPSEEVDSSEEETDTPTGQNITESDIVGVYKFVIDDPMYDSIIADMDPEAYEAMKETMSDDQFKSYLSSYTEISSCEFTNGKVKSTVDLEKDKQLNISMMKISYDSFKNNKEKFAEAMGMEVNDLDAALVQYGVTYDEFVEEMKNQAMSSLENEYTEENIKEIYGEDSVMLDNGMVLVQTADYSIVDNKVIVKGNNETEMTYEDGVLTIVKATGESSDLSNKVGVKLKKIS